MKQDSRLLFASLTAAIGQAFPGEYDHIKPREKSKEDEERIAAATARWGRKAARRTLNNLLSHQGRVKAYNQLLS